jgi:hypothetical protein
MMDELAFGLEFATRILVNEDVALFGELVVRPEHGAIVVGAVRGDPVRRARHQQRVAPGRGPRRVHDREQLHAVAHRDEELAFDVGAFQSRRVATLSRPRGDAVPGDRYKQRRGGGEREPAGHRGQCNLPRARNSTGCRLGALFDDGQTGANAIAGDDIGVRVAG